LLDLRYSVLVHFSTHPLHAMFVMTSWPKPSPLPGWALMLRSRTRRKAPTSAYFNSGALGVTKNELESFWEEGIHLVNATAMPCRLHSIIVHV